MAHVGVSRRAFLTGTAAAGLTLAVHRDHPVEAADPKVLKVRSYVHLEILDPAFQLAAPEGDIIDALLLGLIGLKPGDTWGWERDAALSIEQVDPTHIKFQLRPGLGWTGGFGDARELGGTEIEALAHSSFAAGDFDADRKLDLALFDADSRDVVMWLGDGRGDWEKASKVRFAAEVEALSVGDLDTDGAADLVAGTFSDRTITVARGAP